MKAEDETKIAKTKRYKRNDACFGFTHYPFTYFLHLHLYPILYNLTTSQSEPAENFSDASCFIPSVFDAYRASSIFPFRITFDPSYPSALVYTHSPITYGQHTPSAFQSIVLRISNSFKIFLPYSRNIHRIFFGLAFYTFCTVRTRPPNAKPIANKGSIPITTTA
jgi:hypothetical protein